MDKIKEGSPQKNRLSVSSSAVENLKHIDSQCISTALNLTKLKFCRFLDCPISSRALLGFHGHFAAIIVCKEIVQFICFEGQLF